MLRRDGETDVLPAQLKETKAAKRAGFWRDEDEGEAETETNFLSEKEGWDGPQPADPVGGSALPARTARKLSMMLAPPAAPRGAGRSPP